MADQSVRVGVPLQSPWRPTSPFLEYADLAAEAPAAPTFSGESPFLSLYHEEDESLPSNPAAGVLAEVMAELQEPEQSDEFDSLLLEMAASVEEHVSRNAPAHFGDASSYARRVVRVAEDYLAPIDREVQEHLEALSEMMGPVDPAAFSSEELDELLEARRGRGSTPQIEEFFGKLVKKIGAVAKGAVKLVKAGLTGPIGLLLKPLISKVKALVPKLLKKVIAFALKKLPEKYRPALEKVAAKLQAAVEKKLVKKGAGPAALAAQEPSGDAGTASSADPSAGAQPAAAGEPTPQAAPSATDIQAEFDGQLLELLVAGEVVDEEDELELADWHDDPVIAARQTLARRLTELEQGEDPTPLMEDFLPAILPAIKIGIKLIGRERVVGLIGGLLGKFMSPIVGKDLAPTLGKALTDLGLRTFLNSEVGGDSTRSVAGEALARTVEETVRGLDSVPEYAFESPVLLEGYVAEAFEAAAAANLPTLVRSSLRESAGEAGAWIPLPRGSAPTYKKFSRVFPVEVTPQLAGSVRTFGGGSIAGFLRDSFGIAGVTVPARVHIYEVISGSVTAIAKHETLRGLGSAGRQATRQLHPLTREAATALLREPKLGRRAPATSNRSRPFTGQRFYFLEMPSVSAAPRGRVSGLRATLDFPKDEIRVRLFLSEVVAQSIATGLRKKTPASQTLRQLREVFAGPAALLGTAADDGLFRSILEPAGTAGSRVLPANARASMRRTIAEKVMEWTWLRLAEYFEKAAHDFIPATEDARDGVGLLLTFHNPPGMSVLRAVMKGANPPTGHAWPPKHPPNTTVKAIAGGA